jgi:hypothetical protein
MDGESADESKLGEDGINWAQAALGMRASSRQLASHWGHLLLG